MASLEEAIERYRRDHDVAPDREPVILRDALLELMEIVRVHLFEAEAGSDYIAIGPEPSDRVAELIQRVRPRGPDSGA